MVTMYNRVAYLSYGIVKCFNVAQLENENRRQINFNLQNHFHIHLCLCEISQFDPLLLG
jgi:hypothetical protein